MHRDVLLDKLARYAPSDEAEQHSHSRIIDFVRQYPNCFDRSLSVGHITGSAWLIDPSGNRALLTYHRKLSMWLQLGGHADGDPDILSVALREAREESGIESISPVSEEVFDVDVHAIPAWGADPPHHHYDVRFLLRATTDQFALSDESHAVAWFTDEELGRLPVDSSVRRMQRKWRGRLA